MTALPSSGAFTMVDPSHVEAVGPAAAILFARILWRSQRDGEWAATRETLMVETGLNAGVVKGALRVLREREWITSHRASAQDATTVWTPVLAGQPDMVNLTNTHGESDQMELVNTATSSYETEETTTLPHLTGEDALFDAPAVDPQPRLRAVPSEDDLDAEFAGFWRSYPRKVGKKAARVRYGKVRRTATVEQIAGALRAAVPDLQEREPRYVPHPASWLNDEPWQDGPAEVVPSPMTNAELCSGRPLSPERQAEVDAWNARQSRAYPVTR